MYINAMGFYVPAERIDNAYFKEINGLDDDWIRQRTGIETRSKAADGENVNTMAIDAVNDALKTLPYDIKDVNLIVAAHYCICDTVATVAHEVQRKFAINGAKAVCATSACSSFINGLEIIEGYFASGKADKALLICSEHNTYYSNETDPKSGHLWGDGAVAYFVSKDKMADTDIAVTTIYTEGLGDIGKGPGGVKLRPAVDGITMPDGRDVFLHACRYMIHALDRALAQAGMERKDVKKFICHQANKRIVAQVAHQLDLTMDDFVNNITQLGNTGSASAPLVLAQHTADFAKGDRVALMVFGGGYSCGCFLVEF